MFKYTQEVNGRTKISSYLYLTPKKITLSFGKNYKESLQKKCDSQVEYIWPNLFHTFMYITFQGQNIKCMYSVFLYVINYNLYTFNTDTGEVEKVGMTCEDRSKDYVSPVNKG